MRFRIANDRFLPGNGHSDLGVMKSQTFAAALLICCTWLAGVGTLQAGRLEESRYATITVKPSGGPVKLPYYETIIGATIMLPATNHGYVILARTANYGLVRYSKAKLIWGRCF